MIIRPISYVSQMHIYRGHKKTTVLRYLYSCGKNLAPVSIPIHLF